MRHRGSATESDSDLDCRKRTVGNLPNERFPLANTLPVCPGRHSLSYDDLFLQEQGKVAKGETDVGGGELSVG